MTTALRLDAITSHLNSGYFDTNKTHLDGRVAASMATDHLLRAVERVAPDVILAESSRSWFSFKLGGNPVGIMITEKSGANNLSGSMRALYYAMTGIEYSKGVTYPDYVKSLYANAKPNFSDYYILGYNTKDRIISWTSLKRLTSTVANANNLPFQVNWSHNADMRIERNAEHGNEFLQQALMDSLSKETKYNSLHNLVRHWNQ